VKRLPHNWRGADELIELIFVDIWFGLGFVHSRIGDRIVWLGRCGFGRSGFEDFLEVVHIVAEDPNDFDSLFSRYGMGWTGGEDGGGGNGDDRA
jgi:hypothetical protein